MQRPCRRVASRLAHLEVLSDDGIVEECLEKMILVMQRKGSTGPESQELALCKAPVDHQVTMLDFSETSLASKRASKPE